MMSLLHCPLPSSSYRILFLKNTHKTKLQCCSTRAIASSMNGIESLTSSVGSPPSASISGWNLGQKHILLLNVTACAAAISASWLFFSAIPTLLAFKKAAESMEKLLDVTTEELPDTMAAVRLSGMEISDLTMELSDIGQEITQGVRSSTRAVRLAEDRLRRLTTMAPTVQMQGQAPQRDEKEGPVLAKTARNLREGIMKGRAVLGVIFSITQFSRWALNFVASRQQKPTQQKDTL
ncbi:Uncharacterized protein M6B38_241775 [Iris pallida]|uniref:Transmembrane protein n=1 Tax=Iris pallida TaxID=29817 RepID=A0AAX6DJF3_IRIPA|nr:Uncharacterized protein M6B38_241775 [Iris pallida]